MLLCREYSQNQQNNVPQMSDDEWNKSFVNWFKTRVSVVQIILCFMVLKKNICSSSNIHIDICL